MLSSSAQEHWISNNNNNHIAGRRKAANIKEMIKKVEKEIQNSEMSINKFQLEIENKSRSTYFPTSSSSTYNSVPSNTLLEFSQNKDKPFQSDKSKSCSNFKDNNSFQMSQQKCSRDSSSPFVRAFKNEKEPYEQTYEAQQESLHDKCLSANDLSKELLKRDEEIVASLTACLKQQIVPQIKNSILKEIRGEILQLKRDAGSQNLKFLDEQLSELRSSFDRSKFNKLSTDAQSKCLDDKIIYLDSLYQNIQPLLESFQPIIHTIQPILQTFPNISELKSIIEFIPTFESIKPLIDSFPSSEAFKQSIVSILQIEELLPSFLSQQEQIIQEAQNFELKIKDLEAQVAKLLEIPIDQSIVIETIRGQLQEANSHHFNLSQVKKSNNEVTNKSNTLANTQSTGIVQSIAQEENGRQNGQKQMIGRYSNADDEHHEDSQVIENCNFSSPFFNNGFDSQTISLEQNNSQCNYEISPAATALSEIQNKDLNQKQEQGILYSKTPSQIFGANLAVNRQLFQSTSLNSKELKTENITQSQRNDEFNPSLANSDHINYVKKGLPQLFPLVNSTYFAQASSPPQYQSNCNLILRNSEDPILLSGLNSQILKSDANQSQAFLSQQNTHNSESLNKIFKQSFQNYLQNGMK